MVKWGLITREFSFSFSKFEIFWDWGSGFQNFRQFPRLRVGLQKSLRIFEAEVWNKGSRILRITLKNSQNSRREWGQGFWGWGQGLQNFWGFFEAEGDVKVLRVLRIYPQKPSHFELRMRARLLRFVEEFSKILEKWSKKALKIAFKIKIFRGSSKILDWG